MGSHKGVVTLFCLIFVKTEKFSRNLGKYLQFLKMIEERGDCKIFSYKDKKTAEKIMAEAREFLKESNYYLKS